MNGTVLHYDTERGEGVVKGEDGLRYAFAAADWRSHDRPQPGLAVDIVPSETFARDIYVIPPAAPSQAGPAAAPATASVRTAAPATDWDALARERIGIAPAAVILLASLLPFLAIPVLQPSLWSVPGFARELASGFPASYAGTKLLLWCTYLLWSIPLGAAWLIYAELQDGPCRDDRVRIGLLGLGLPFLLAVLIKLAAPDVLGGGDLGGIVSLMAIGWVIVALASLVLIVTGAYSWEAGDAAARESAPPVPASGSRTCPACGSAYDGARLFCPRDGTDLV